MSWTASPTARWPDPRRRSSPTRSCTRPCCARSWDATPFRASASSRTEEGAGDVLGRALVPVHGGVEPPHRPHVDSSGEAPEDLTHGRVVAPNGAAHDEGRLVGGKVALVVHQYGQVHCRDEAVGRVAGDDVDAV